MRYIMWLKPSSGKTLTGILYEAYLSCGGDWKSSKIYLSVKEKHSRKRQGVRKWMIRPEIERKFGVEGANAIIDRKEGEEELRLTEIRDHPECPGNKDLGKSRLQT